MAIQSNLVTYEQACTAARRLVSSAHAAAEHVERGQADLPLADYFRALEHGINDESWTLCAVVQVDAFAPLVSWLCGAKTQVSANTRHQGFLELTFHGERFGLESSSGRTMFDSLASLLAALTPHDSLTDGSTLKVTAPGDGRVKGLKVLIVIGAEALASDSGLASSLINQSNALWVVGREDWPWDERTREAVHSLQAAMDFYCPIILETLGPLAQSGWWSTGLTIARTPPIRLGSTHTPPLPVLVRQETSELRRALRLTFLARRARQGLDTLKERLELLRQQQRARRQREERSERELGEGAAEGLVRGPIDLARTGLADEITVLQKGLQDSSRRSLGREGSLAAAVDGLVESVTPDDLLQSPSGRQIVVTLDETFTTRFARELRQVFKEELRRDLVTVRDGLRIAGEAVQRRLQETLGVSMPLDLPPPEERPIREVLSDVIQLQLRYRGEIPKRSFFGRLGEARRMLFAVIMTVTLFGYLVTGSNNVRAMVIGRFGLLFVVLFIGVVLWTYRSWKREDEERIKKEIAKIREQLQTEAMRLVRDGERERLGRLSEALDAARRDALRRIEDFGRQITQQAAANQARERNAVRERIRLIDQRTKELDALRSTLQRTEQEATEMSRQTDGLLRQTMTGQEG